MLNNLKIGVKLPVVTVMVGLLSLVLVELIANVNAEATSILSGEERLRAVAESRAGEVLQTLQGIRSDVEGTFDNTVTLEAVRAFVTRWRLHPGDARTDLRRVYLDDNPYPRDERHRLVAADDRSAYALVHRRYQPYFLAQLEEGTYSDIYVIAPDGRVVYSVAKQDLFGRSLDAPGMWTTPLALAYRHVRVAARAGAKEGAFTRFVRDGERPGAYSAILAIPILSPLGNFEAVLAVRVPARVFDPILTRPAGLGRTGESVLIGLGQEVLTRSRGAAKPVIEESGAPIPAVRAVLAGERGVAHHPGPDGIGIVTGFAPVEFMGERFGILAQQNEGEILAPARVMRRKVFEEGLVALSAVTVLGLVLSRSMSVPLTRLGEAMRQVAAGNYGAPIRDRERGDEIGTIARRLDAFRAALLEAGDLARENAFKSAAFASASAAIMLVDRDLTIIHVNKSLEELVARRRIAFDRLVPNFREDALVGRSLSAFVPGAERARAALTDGGQFTEEMRLGQTYLQVSMGPVMDGDGTVLGYVLEWEDVSDAQHTQAVLRAVDAHLQVAGFSPDGRLVSANRAFETWLGMSEAEMIGLDWERLFSGGGGTEGGTAGWRVAEDGIDCGAPLELVPRGRAGAAARVLLSAARDEARRIQRVILIGIGEAGTPEAEPRERHGTGKKTRLMQI